MMYDEVETELHMLLTSTLEGDVSTASILSLYYRKGAGTEPQFLIRPARNLFAFYRKPLFQRDEHRNLSRTATAVLDRLIPDL
jgi:hypothetical protein